MKKLLFTLALLISFSSFGQISIIDIDNIEKKYPTTIEVFKDDSGNIIDMEYASTYEQAYFEGDLFKSNGVFIDYYLGQFINEEYELAGPKMIRFESYNNSTDELVLQMVISFWRNGDIKDIKYICGANYSG